MSIIIGAVSSFHHINEDTCVKMSPIFTNEVGLFILLASYIQHQTSLRMGGSFQFFPHYKNVHGLYEHG